MTEESARRLFSDHWLALHAFFRMADAELVPHGAEGVPVSVDGVVAREAGSGRQKFDETVVEAAAIFGSDATEKIEESEVVALPGFVHYDGERGGASLGIIEIEIHDAERNAEFFGGVGKIRRARTVAGKHFRGSARGNHGLHPVVLKLNPALGDFENAGAVGIDVERVSAAHVERIGGGSAHKKNVGRRGDFGVNRAALEDGFFARARSFEQVEARIRAEDRKSV